MVLNLDLFTFIHGWRYRNDLDMGCQNTLLNLVNRLDGSCDLGAGTYEALPILQGKEPK